MPAGLTMPLNLDAYVHAVDVTAHLLKIASADLAEYRAATSDDDVREDEEFLAQDVYALLKDKLGSRIDPADREQIDVLLRNYGRLPDFVAARGIAKGIDLAMGSTFFDTLARRGSHPLGDGDCFPYPISDLRTALGKLSPPRYQLPQHPGELKHLGLWRSDITDLSVTLNYEIAVTLLPVLHGDRFVISTGHPNQSLDEFVIPPTDRHRVFGIKPSDLIAQQSRLGRLIELADELQAEILVFPELCLEDRILPEVATIAAQSKNLKLVVLGSVHSNQSGHNRNRCWIWLRDHGLLSTDKREPATFHDQTESIRSSRDVSVWVSPAISMMVLVCRDALDAASQAIISKMGINLLIVPAMSPGMSSFQGALAAVSTSAQGIGIVANNPQNFGDDEIGVQRGWISLPVETSALIPIPSTPDPENPVLATLDSSQGREVRLAALDP